MLIQISKLQDLVDMYLLCYISSITQLQNTDNIMQKSNKNASACK